MHRLLKFTLDLFDVAPVFELAPRVQPKAPRNAPPQTSPKRSKKIEAAPTPVPPSSGDVFSRHPQASQHTRLQGHGVDYELRRSRRRTITFSVSPAGLSVRAPTGMTLRTIEDAVQEKSRWIVSKIGGMQQRQERIAAQQVIWQDGAQLAYLGQTLQVRLTDVASPSPPARHAAKGIALLTPMDAPTQPVTDQRDQTQAQWTLVLALPMGASAEQIRNATKAWLLRQAMQHYSERMDHFAKQLGVTWRKLALSGASTRWGSAKADGSIRLHWRLMQFSPEMIDYVVAHELSHLRELNHSPRFWATLASVLPDYEQPQKRLKAAVLPVWE
ncbi:MAG: SprT family zinc-dependent metalloprotease [Burkholderiaceae bacterium]|nr:SprT family zinc-dependent metalloprotease [Burkholderiaceae bacterium]